MKPTILVDTREQTPFEFSDEVSTERATLPTGDYSIAGFTDRIVFERKSPEDLIHCCTWDRDRFMACCGRLSTFERAAIVVEASVHDILHSKTFRSQANPRSIIGTTNAIWLDFGVPTLWFGDAAMAARAVERMLVRFARNGGPLP